MTSPADAARLDVLRVPAPGRAAGERAAEDVAVLAAAGLSVGVRWDAAAGPLAPPLAAAVVEGRCVLVLADETPHVAVLAVDEAWAAGSPAAVLPAAAATVTVRPALAGPAGEDDWPLAVEPGRWARPAPTGPVTAGVLLPPGRRAAQAVAAAVRAALPPGARAVVLRAPGGAVPRGWAVRDLDAGATRPQVLAGLHVVVDATGDPLWTARALAGGTPVWHLVGVGLGDRLVAPGAEPVPVPALADRLARLADPDVAGTARLEARAAAAQHHGPERLLRAVARRLPDPGRVAPGTAVPGPQPSRRTVLMMSSNGTGMGHLTRLVAMARRASDAVEVHLASMSQAVTVAAGDLPYDYIPSGKDLGINTRRWNAIFARRVQELVARLRPAALVFDGAYPYAGLLAAIEAAGVPAVWSRRAMWKVGRGATQLARADAFDLVIEPGEVAAAADAGLTVRRTDAARVRPVVLLDEHDLLPADDARAALGLEPGRPTALVTLGAGSLRDIGSELGAVVAGVAALPGDVQIAVTRPVIAATEGALAERVHGLSIYPIARYLRAFDFAVSAGGYNSFHESIAYAVPTAFVPNTTHLDDQTARVRWAHEQGAGVLLDPVTPVTVPPALEVLADPARRDAMAARCREVWPGNGAAEAMGLVERLVDGASPAELRAPLQVAMEVR